MRAFPDCGFLWIPVKCTFLKPSCNLPPPSLSCLSFTRLNGKNTLTEMAVTTAALLTWPKDSCGSGRPPEKETNYRKGFPEALE